MIPNTNGKKWKRICIVIKMVKQDKHLKIKEQICDALIGKKFEIVWSEHVEYTTSVFATSEEEAREKWDGMNTPMPQINSSQMLDDSLEIIEIPKEEWNK